MLKPKFMWPDAVRRRVWECREWFIESQVYTYSNTSLWSWVSLFFFGHAGFFQVHRGFGELFSNTVEDASSRLDFTFLPGVAKLWFLSEFFVGACCFLNLYTPWWLWLEWFDCVFLRWNSASYWNSGCFELEHLAKCHDIFMEQQLRSLWMEVMLNGWHMKD